MARRPPATHRPPPTYAVRVAASPLACVFDPGQSARRRKGWLDVLCSCHRPVRAAVYRAAVGRAQDAAAADGSLLSGRNLATSGTAQVVTSYSPPKKKRWSPRIALKYVLPSKVFSQWCINAGGSTSETKSLDTFLFKYQFRILCCYVKKNKKNLNYSSIQKIKFG